MYLYITTALSSVWHAQRVIATASFADLSRPVYGLLCTSKAVFVSQRMLILYKQYSYIVW